MFFLLYIVPAGFAELECRLAVKSRDYSLDKLSDFLYGKAASLAVMTHSIHLGQVLSSY